MSNQKKYDPNSIFNEALDRQEIETQKNIVFANENSGFTKEKDKKSIGLKIGIILAVLHLCLVGLTFIGTIGNHSSTIGILMIPFMIIDAPLNYVLPPSMGWALLFLGIWGSLMWLLIPWLIDWITVRIFLKANNIVRRGAIFGAIFVVLVGFSFLNAIKMGNFMRDERPAELKEVINQASSNFLNEKIVYVKTMDNLSSINWMNCQEGNEKEIALSSLRGVTFLDRNYTEIGKVTFSSVFSTVNPIFQSKDDACNFIGYKSSESVSLLDSKGKENWKIDSTERDYISGVKYGDINKDGKIEFVVFYDFGKGIQLFDDAKNLKWEYPIYSLGHLEIADTGEDGKNEIIFSNGNNADKVTEFKFLNSNGEVDKQFKIATQSSQFAIINWPDINKKSNILLTENNNIRLVDLNGETVIQLNAPGCRTFGDVKAVTVKFKKNEPAFLAVRKILMPDIAVLYIYDIKGNLVYNKTETFTGNMNATLVAVPTDEEGGEKLLVGSEGKNYGSQLIEYSISQKE